jgi:hypothetical protein
MYCVQINGVKLYHGTKSACFDYVKAYQLSGSLIKYITIPKSSKIGYYLGDFSCICALFIIVITFISALV